MYLVSLSQPHNPLSVPELARSLELEHEVRREVTLQVTRWFGQVNDTDQRWKMEVEKVARQGGLDTVASASVQGLLGERCLFPPSNVSSFNPNFALAGTLCLLLAEVTQYRRTSSRQTEYRHQRYFHSNTPLKRLRESE